MYQFINLFEASIQVHFPARPLEGSCRMELLKFDHPQGQAMFVERFVWVGEKHRFFENDALGVIRWLWLGVVGLVFG